MAFPRYSWVAVGYNAYALALNEGYQYDPSFWIAHVNPSRRWPYYSGLSAKPYPVSQRYIFFFVDKRNDFVGNVPGRAYLIAQYNAQTQMTVHWIQQWSKRFGPMPIYFQNAQLTVYWLKNLANPAD
jgi:hypothetical protein